MAAIILRKASTITPATAAAVAATPAPTAAPRSAKPVLRPSGTALQVRRPAPAIPAESAESAQTVQAAQFQDRATGDTEYRSPFKASASADTAKPFQPPPLKPRPVFKILGGKSITPHSHSVKAEPTHEELVAMGLIDEHGNRVPTSAERWPDVMIGEKVKITNSMFPWVLHYRPGDVAVVEAISTAINAHQDDPIKYRNHTLRIISDGPTKGQRALLFRWEFEPHKAESTFTSTMVKN